MAGAAGWSTSQAERSSAPIRPAVTQIESHRIMQVDRGGYSSGSSAGGWDTAGAERLPAFNDVCPISTGSSQDCGGRLNGARGAPPGCPQVVENGDLLTVHESSEPMSPVVTELEPHTPLCVIAMEELSDGTKRARIVRHTPTQAAPPLGWVTAKTADGRALLHYFARPLYEIIVPTKVRHHAKTDSRPICLLPPGMRVHVVDNCRVGKVNRARVALADQDEPLGWLSVLTVAGVRTIHSLDAPSPWTPPASLPTSSQRPQRAPGDMKWGSAVPGQNSFYFSTIANRPQPRAESSRKLPASADLPAPRSPSTASLGSGTPSSPPSVSPVSPRARFKALSMATPAPATAATAPATAASSAVDVPTPARRSSFALQGLLRKVMAAEALATPAKAKSSGTPAKPTADFAALVKAAVKEFWCPGGGLTSKSAHITVEEACTQILGLYADQKSNVFRTSDVQAAVALLEKRASEEDKIANGTSLSAQIGEILAGRGAKKLDDLLCDWDPNGDGSVTKQEFRVCVRKLFKKLPDTREVDGLFVDLDSDGGGELSMAELKVAFKKMIAAHNNRKAAHDNAMAKATAFRERAKALREGSIACAVRASEAACVAFQEVGKSGSLNSQLGDVINSKGMKASDVATKWDASGDGELDKKEVIVQALCHARPCRRARISLHALFLRASLGCT